MPIRKGPSASAPGRAGYHHGDLRHALVAATEAILVEAGVEGFSLREAARRAGVSPAAPAHHFGDASGLLTEVAVLGFEGLTAALQAADATGGGDPAARLRAQAAAYVRYALAHRARFQLMFRWRVLRGTDPRLSQAANAAFGTLEAAVRAAAGLDALAPLPTDVLAALIGAWSLPHGFAHLAIDGQFDHVAGTGSAMQVIEQILEPVMARVPLPVSTAARPALAPDRPRAPSPGGSGSAPQAGRTARPAPRKRVGRGLVGRKPTR
jgi:AcrR family transcriptional regulator